MKMVHLEQEDNLHLAISDEPEKKSMESSPESTIELNDNGELVGLEWLAILRYRFLTPFMLATVVVEQLLRLGAGQLKPLEVAAAPPGATGSYLLQPPALLAFILFAPASQNGLTTGWSRRAIRL